MLDLVLHFMYAVLLLLGFVCVYIYYKQLSRTTDWYKHVCNVNRYKSFYNAYCAEYAKALANPCGDNWYTLTLLLDYGHISYSTDYKMSIEDRIRNLPKLDPCDNYTARDGISTEDYKRMHLKHLCFVVECTCMMLCGYLFMVWSMFNFIW